jgi:hypothetical protein
MSRQEFSLNGHTLEIEREMIEVTSNLPQRDPRWKQTDERGHLHMAVREGGMINDRVTYPTLVIRYGDEQTDEDGETWREQWWACRECGATVVPGVIYDRSRKFIPGLTTYTLDGEHIPPAQAQAFIESWQRQADDRSSRRAQADREAGYL